MTQPFTKRWKLVLATCFAFSACAVIHPPAPNLPSRSEITPGETITVKGNQNVYGVAREYNASMREIIVLNNLQPPFTLKAGQRLILPANAGEVPMAAVETQKGLAPSPVSAPAGDIEKTELAPIAVAPVKSAPVETLNAPMAPPKPVPTTVTSTAVTPTQPTQAAVATTAPLPLQDKPKQPVAAVPATAPLAAAPVTSPVSASPPTAETMKWPVQGPILSSFGPKGQGLNNDGINIGAPKGAPVTAAAGGIVVYAGSEMKGFGNLVLIRHQGGWVTAYAHLDRMLVSKDAVVAQGDMIGTVGKTGDVPSPQLHFETRYQGKPVDPAGVIKG